LQTYIEESRCCAGPTRSFSPGHESYLFERRADTNSGILRNEARPLKNFAVLLSYETVGNFVALHGLPILAYIVKAISQFTRAYHVDSMRRQLRSIQPCSLDLHFAVDRQAAHGTPAQGGATETESSVPACPRFVRVVVELQSRYRPNRTAEMRIFSRSDAKTRNVGHCLCPDRT